MLLHKFTNFFAHQANIDEMYPQELDLFKEKAFVFKVQVKTEFFNYTEQTNIQVNRLVTDDALIKSFLDKYKIEEVINFVIYSIIFLI